MKNANAHKFYLALAFVLIFCATCFSGCINEHTIAQTYQLEHDWMNTEMTNAATGEIFTLHELARNGTPVVVHLVATWCSYCNAQFGESTTFLENYPGKAHVVQIGIDTRETQEHIASHAASKGYEGIFTVAEEPVMQGFMALFGEEIMMGIPQTIIIYGNDIAYLGAGVRSSDTIASRVDEGYQQPSTAVASTTAAPKQVGTEWMNAEMTDVITGERFTLHGLAEDGVPIVLHLITTWCPACNVQFAESTAFLEKYPEKAHVVLIGIDPRETSVHIADYMTGKGYEGIFTTAEASVMQALMDLFGQTIMMSIPQTVIISGENFAYLGPSAITSTEIVKRIDAINQQLGK